MTRRAIILLVILLAFVFTAMASSSEPDPCLMNPPPNAQFDPECTAACAKMFPSPGNAEERCECMLGCLRPIDDPGL